MKFLSFECCCPNNYCQWGLKQHWILLTWFHFQYCHKHLVFWWWAIQRKVSDANLSRRRYLVFLYALCHIYCKKVRVFICSRSAFFHSPPCNKCRGDVITGPLRIKGLTACDDCIKKHPPLLLVLQVSVPQEDRTRYTMTTNVVINRHSSKVDGAFVREGCISQLIKVKKDD